MRKEKRKELNEKLNRLGIMPIMTNSEFIRYLKRYENKQGATEKMKEYAKMFLKSLTRKG